MHFIESNMLFSAQVDRNVFTSDIVV